ncbi:PD40 domain-containing protein [Flammeovirga pacifica]|uniref:OmpA-like domain-containing protein n=1 Tax=Flammeovirga pacifica TaxID=915059 RepID=A0A1S1YY81_FLAPC|nr:PD40 domain-containing protein [Flammeovirga pacifica]OHX65966.1 hypothetical protein NH26_06185 [Flammeovirga pacifica]
MKRLLIILFSLFIGSNHIFAQEDPDTQNITLSEDEFGFVWQLIGLGDSLFYNFEQPDEALKYYEGAYDFLSDNYSLNKKIGDCYLKSVTEDKTLSLPYLKKVIQNHQDSLKSDDYYNMGSSFHFNEEFDSAIHYYELSYIQADTSFISTIEKRIYECINGSKFYKNFNNHIIIKNLGPSVNSKYADFCPLVDAVENRLYFTSRRHEFRNDNPDIRDHLSENIYYSQRKDFINWNEPVPLPYPVNNDDHSATVSISMDGSEMILYGNGDLLSSSMESEGWNKPKKLSKNINSIFVETSACINTTMDTLYFVSNNEYLSLGGLDIFMSIKNAKGKWGKPINIGPEINTKYDEEGVALSMDGNTLYFASRGHDSMGGYDIFKSTKDFQGNWSKAENLGIPINSPFDDVYFMIRTNGRHAYYSSARKGGYGEKDIYRISILDDEKPLSIARRDISYLYLDKDSVHLERAKTHHDPLMDIKKNTLTATTDLLKTLFFHASLTTKDSVNQVE